MIEKGGDDIVLNDRKGSVGIALNDINTSIVACYNFNSVNVL